MGQPQQSKKKFKQKWNFPVSLKQQASTKLSTVNHNCVKRSLIRLSALLKEVKIDVLAINQVLLLRAKLFISMPKNTDIHSH